MNARYLIQIALTLISAICSHAAVLYVDINSTNPIPPYVDWPSAATNIQDAVDAANAGDQILATNGVYATGGRVVFGAMTNRVAITKPVTVQSANGPDWTIIRGFPSVSDYAVRCVYMTNGAALIGFTITNGATRATGDTYLEQSGGGIWCESSNVLVRNCLIVSNSAQLYGGGVYNATLTNCTVAFSQVIGGDYTTGGGGLFGGTAIDCILSNNFAAAGGGAYAATLTNCWISGNMANGSYGGGGAYKAQLFNCTVSNNSTYGYGGGINGGTSSNCVIIKNLANDGGGAYEASLISCNIVSNSCSAGFGLGASFCTLTNCTIFRNLGGLSAGIASSIADGCLITDNLSRGAYESTVYNCVITNSMNEGAYRSTLSHCIIAGNSNCGARGCKVSYCVIKQNNSSDQGAGARTSTLDNCLIVSNTLSGGSGGAGANFSTLSNCTVVGNVAAFAAGTVSCTNLNSIVYFNFNSSSSTTSNHANCQWTNSCTTPAPAGRDNLTNAPLFVNRVGNNLHLESNSPCINAGNNLFAVNNMDLDGNTRIKGFTVDIGAYEYQSPSSRLSYAWAQQYGLSADGSADYADNDQDGMNNWNEWIAGTNPTNAASTLIMLSLSSTNFSGPAITWQSVTNRTYYLQRSTNLTSQPAFSTTFSNLAGQLGTTTFTDTNTVGLGSAFYRVGVQ